MLNQSVRDLVRECTGLKLTEAQAEAALADSEIQFEIDRWGLRDTETTASVCNFYVRLILGRDIPTYGEHVEHAAFWAELARKGTEMGYTFDTP